MSRENKDSLSVIEEEKSQIMCLSQKKDISDIKIIKKKKKKKKRIERKTENEDKNLNINPSLIKKKRKRKLKDLILNPQIE